MKDRILGLHHITAIAGDPQQNFDFFTKVLGLRMVKKTVNFDDPKTYHFYFGDEVGTPGSILTFFPWPRVRKGHTGAGMATEISYAVPDGSLDFWKSRFEENNVRHQEISEKFGEKFLAFEDPDGLNLELTVPDHIDNRKGWITKEVEAHKALKGFHSVALTLNVISRTAKVLEDIFEYEFEKQENNRHRFRTDAVENAGIVDLIEAPNAAPGINAGGTNHHVAFRVKNEEILMNFREKVLQKGFQITDKINRDYFFSLYFREPGGVLFEIATDNPGFSIDEPVGSLGSSLKLPKQYEDARAQIEKILPDLKH